MGWIARSQLASAVSNAGGARHHRDVDQARSTRAWPRSPACATSPTSRSASTSPQAVHRASRASSTSWPIRACKFVTTSAGIARQVHLPTLEGRGLTVYPRRAQPARSALKAVDAGVDGLVVEGGEGGGFKNPDAVVDAGAAAGWCASAPTSPIIAAGGIRRRPRAWRPPSRSAPRASRWARRFVSAGREPGSMPNPQAGDRRGRRHRHHHAEPQIEPLRACAGRPSAPRRSTGSRLVRPIDLRVV